MYYFFLGTMALPVAPGALSIKINGGNKTVRLIDDSEINIIKNPGLTDVSFEFLVPSVKYPFCSPLGVLSSGSEIFRRLEELKTSKAPFRFIVTRMRGSFDMLFRTNLKVTLENYEIKESSEYGFDQMVAVQLKQYRDYGTKVLETDSNGNATVKNSRG